jgi:hypothetical protein
MEVGKKTGGRLGRTFNGKRLFQANTFCSKFPRESSFSDQFPRRWNRHIITQRLIVLSDFDGPVRE